jgi:hypothetical protein
MRVLRKEEIACKHLIPPAAKKKEVYGKHLLRSP